MTSSISRRSFLKSSAVSAAALVIGFDATGVMAATDPGRSTTIINPFVHVNTDGTITVIAKHFEMGQGTTTGLATLVAEEMDMPWHLVHVEYAPSNPDVYKNLFFGSQGTGGSTAIANSFMQYREAGAVAIDLLKRAAAKKLGVPPESISVDNGQLVSGSNSLSLGDVAVAAAELTPAEKPELKTPEQFKLIGSNSLPRKDSAEKTTGKAIFAMDVKVDNMLYVVVLRAPKFGATLKTFNATNAQDIKGFVDAKALPNKTGVAVFASSTWSAIQSRQAITATWDDTAAELRSSDQLLQKFNDSLAATPQFNATPESDFDNSWEQASKANKYIDATFQFPLLAHAPMEPLNCVIEPTENGVLVHDGCQMPTLTHNTVAAILQLPPESVEIKTYLAGGSFGRRANFTSDYHSEAAMAYALLDGKHAVKLIWTREDDLAGGYYRPQVAHKARISIEDNGKIDAWAHHVVAQPIFKGTFFESFVVKNGVDHASVEGIADTPYRLNNFSVGLTDFESPVSNLWWRSVGHSHTGYVMEVLMDMAAEAANRDPLEFRLDHLDVSDPDQERLAGVLKLVAEKSDWGATAKKGMGQGIAVHKSFNSYVAQVASVSVNDAGAISIDKIVCAVDCGIAVNPDVIRAQMEGSIGYGLGSVMRNQITLNNGVVDQKNFPQYEPLRMSDMPHIETHIVQSSLPPSGVGEPGLPPAGPALANAIFNATGKRITSLPMASNGVTFS